jgi:hypothetical protein
LPKTGLVEAVRRLADRAKSAGGSLIVATSPRTPAWAVQAIQNSGAGCRLVADGSVRYSVLLADADENFVTADSVSMISEAILTGNWVGLIPVELDRKGLRKLGNKGFSNERRDLRRFWADLYSKGLVGTIDEPARGKVEDPVKLAALAVRRLLGDGVE